MRFWQNCFRKRFVYVALALVFGVAEDIFAQTPRQSNPFDTVAVATVDSVDSASDRTATKKIPIVNRNFNYRRQLGMALGMMAFALLFLTSTQSWNPD
jgi:hypothetical protein